MTEAKTAKETWEKWTSLIHKVIQKTFRHAINASNGRRALDYDDLYQEGVIGLLSAIKYFDANKEGATTFKNYAWIAISREIGAFVDKNMTPVTTPRYRAVLKGSAAIQEKHRIAVGCVLFSELASFNKAPFQPFSEALSLSGDESADELASRLDLVEHAMQVLREKLPPKRLELLLSFFGGDTLAALGARYGVSHETIRNRVRASLEKARGLLLPLREDVK